MSGYVLQAFQLRYAFERNVLPVSSDCYGFLLISVEMSDWVCLDFLLSHRL